MEEIKQYNPEMEFIKEVIRVGAMKEAVKGKFTKRIKTNDGFRYPFFKEGSPAEQLMHFLFEHYQEHKKTASLETVQKHFPGFQLTEQIEPLSYWAKELRLKRKREKLAEGLTQAVQMLQAKNALDAEKTLIKLVSEIQSEINITADMDWNEDVEERIALYEKRKTRHGLLGISYAGIDPLDEALGGIQDGQLITIAAVPKTGKTYFEVLIAANAIKDGKNVVFITREMTAIEIANRVDIYFFALNAEKHKLGKLSEVTEQNYFEELRKLKDDKMLGKLIISGDNQHGYGVSAIQAKIDEYQPDLVIVDGSYLLEDEDGGKAMWEKVTNITRKLKRLANSTGVPIIQSSQVSAKTGKIGKANDQSHMAFSQSFAQDSDVILELYRDNDMKAMSKMGVNVMLAREGNPVNVILHWDFEDMKNFGKPATDYTPADMEDDEDEQEAIIFE